VSLPKDVYIGQWIQRLSGLLRSNEFLIYFFAGGAMENESAAAISLMRLWEDSSQAVTPVFLVRLRDLDSFPASLGFTTNDGFVRTPFSVGRGPFGLVYLAMDTSTRRVLIAKREPGRKEAYEVQEYSTADHPRIAYARHIEERSTETYVYFDYFPGSNLRSLIDQSNVTETDRLRFFAEIVQLIGHLLPDGMFSEYVTLNKFLVDESGHLFLKRPLVQQSSNPNYMRGINVFTSLDELKNCKLTPKTLVWNLGILLHELWFWKPLWLNSGRGRLHDVNKQMQNFG